MTLGSAFTMGGGGQTIQAEKLFLNKLYFESDGGYDIGLIQLKNNAVLGKIMKHIFIILIQENITKHNSMGVLMHQS